MYLLKENIEIFDVDYPSAPINSIASDKEVSYIVGDTFKNTLPHKNNSTDGLSNVRVGETVPEDAVSLAYYYNSKSSLTDTVSVIETNTSAISIRTVNEWRYLYSQAQIDDDLFDKNIEFIGENGTEYEGYWGTLYRESVLWDKVEVFDQNQEQKTIDKVFNGIYKKEIPTYIIYDDGVKKGRLDLSYSLYYKSELGTDLLNDIDNDARVFKAIATYSGIIKESKIKFNGAAKYTGLVTKKDAISNLDPEQETELIMFPNAKGELHTVDGVCEIQDNLFYITDKFSDDTPLYYYHKLKYKIYDSEIFKERCIDNIKLTLSGIPISDSSKYKYKVYLYKTDKTNVYDGYVYTSFVPQEGKEIQVIYNGLSEDYSNVNEPSKLPIKTGIVEKLNVIQAIDTDKYTVNTDATGFETSSIVMKNTVSQKDDRPKIKIKYNIEYNGVECNTITAYVINKDSALYSEKKLFIDDDMIISDSNITGFMNAKEMFLANLPSDAPSLDYSSGSYKVNAVIDNIETFTNKEKVILFTDTDGTKPIYARTFENTSSSSIINDPNSIYVSKDGYIYKGYSVKCRNINKIVIAVPNEKNPLKGWYPRIKNSYFDKIYYRTDSSLKLIYSTPEFNNQNFGKYGKPYVDIVDESPTLINKNTIKTNNMPLYVKLDSNGVPNNIEGYRISSDGVKTKLTVSGFNFIEGYINFSDLISNNDNVRISYTYEEQYYHYRGYYNNFNKDTKMINLNVNPIIYNTYTDNSNEELLEKETYGLFNKTINFFVRPTKVIDVNTGDVRESNELTMYHTLNSQDSLGPFDLHIGKMFIRHHASLKSTTLIDTRRRGGGVLETLSDKLRRELEPDSDSYLDIGTLDGKPYQDNSVVVIRVNSKLLSINGGKFNEDDIKSAVFKWASFGTLPIIEFVDVMDIEDMPINSTIVSKEIENQIKYKPIFMVSLDNEIIKDKDFIISESILGKDEL